MTNEKQRKTKLTNEKQKLLTINRCYLKTGKSWIDYSALNKIRLSTTLMGLAIQNFKQCVTVNILKIGTPQNLQYKVKVSHSLIAEGAVGGGGVSILLYLGHS